MSKYLTDFVPKDPFPYKVHKDIFTSVLSPSGLIPYPCSHGIPVLPPDHPPVHREPRIDYMTGGELPPWGTMSWGRAKYLRITAYGSKGPGMAFAQSKCPVCLGQPRPVDMTEPADAT